MDEQQKFLANKAIEENVEDTTARQVIRYVMACELWGQDTISPSNEYLGKKYGWSNDTTKVAISKAKKSQFITTTGYGKKRCLELNVGFLKGKMAEMYQKSLKPRADFSDVLPNTLPTTLPNGSPNSLPNSFGEENSVPKPQNEENGGYSNRNKNRNNTANADILEVPDSEESTRVPKEKDVQLERAVAYWHKRCKEDYGLEPSGGRIKTRRLIKDAHKTLSYGQIKRRMDQWFDADEHEPHDMIQITKCLSPYQIDKFLAETL